MDGTLVFYILFMSIPVVFVDALRDLHFELYTAAMERDLKYTQVLKHLHDKQASDSDWDRKMEERLNAKYKELFYMAYNDRKGTQQGQREKEMVLQYIYKKHPNISKKLFQEIANLQKPADWRLIKPQKNEDPNRIEDNLLYKDNAMDFTSQTQPQKIESV